MTKAKFQTLSRMLLGRSTAKESLSELLGEIGFDDWRAAASSLERLIERFGAQKRLVRALPTILELLETSASPDRALLNLELLMDRSENQSDLLSSALQTPRMLDMEKRIVEIEKAGDLYKSLFDEIPGAIEKYRQYMLRVRDESLNELEQSTLSMDFALNQGFLKRITIIRVWG